MSAQGVKKYSATYNYYSVTDTTHNYVNHLKCYPAIIVRYRKLKFCPWAFMPVEFESTDKIFIDGMVEKLWSAQLNT